jgi:HTH-type transcriptional regulator/antitoxin HipB
MGVVRIPAQLGMLLRDARLQQGLTLADIARQLGVSVQAVSKLERNAERASFARIHTLCLLLGLEISLQRKPDGVADDTGEW